MCKKMRNLMLKGMCAIFIAVLFCCRMLSIGSDVDVERFDNQVTFVDSLPDNEVLGFAALQGGFLIDAPSTSAIFNSFFPVSGLVEFNFGTMTLLRDLIFREVTAYESLGIILGNDHVMELSAGISKILPAGLQLSFCASDPISTLDAVQAPTCLAFSPDDKFLAVGFGAATKVVIYEFTGSNFIEKGTYTLTRAVNDLSWHPTASYRLAVVTNRRPGNIGEIFTFSVTSLGAIALEDSANPDEIVSAVDWHYTGDWIAVGQAVSGKEVAIYAVDGDGLITEPEVASAPPGVVTARTVRWYPGEDYLAVGVTSASAVNQLVVYEFNQGTPGLVLSAQAAPGFDVTALSWNTTMTYDVLAAGLEASSSPSNPAEVRIYQFVPGVSITQINQEPIGKGVYSLRWNNGAYGSCLAVGRDQGTALVDPFSIWTFDKNNPYAPLDLVTEGPSTADAVTDTEWTNDGAYVVYLADNTNVRLYERDLPRGVRFDNLHVILNADYELEAGLELHISGTSSISGRGNCLTFNENSSIVIDSGSSLLFRDIFVDNVSGSRIRCVDNTCTVTLENTQWTLDGNYTFTKGKFVVIEDDFRVVGKGFSFGYQTDQQSIIGANAKFILDRGVTFNYAPSTGDTDLINLTDSTSEFVLNGATLYSASPGIKLTKGKLRIQGKSFIESDGETEFGDGITAANNLDVCFSDAANLEIKSGTVVDNSV